MRLPFVLGIAATLLVGSVGAAGVLSGNFSGFPALASEASPSDAYGGEIVKVWKGDFTASTGSIDFRLTGGNVWLSTWDEPRYEVTLVKQKADSGQRIGDATLTYDFSATGGKLALTVKQSGNVAIGVNGRATDEIAVVAKVPAGVMWSSAKICSGASSSQFDQVFSQLFAPLGATPVQPSCIDGATMPIDMSVEPKSTDSNSSLTVPFLVDRMKGGALDVRADYGSVALAKVAFDNVTLALQYGAVAVNGSRGASFAAVTQYGSMKLTGLQANTLILDSQYGSILLDSLALGASKADVKTQYGSLLVHVPTGNHGYDVQADTQYGEVSIILEGADVENTDPSPGFTTYALALGGHASALPSAPSPGSSDGSAHSEHARTKGFESKTNQLTLNLATQYGNVRVWDGPFSEDMKQ
ncbi:MAG: DUF4097 family beta strand repeat-containing protein [Thermoplasmatota archaeon]